MNEIIRDMGDQSIIDLERKLSEIDVNLLVALDALLAYRNVTYAARRIGQSQPAMSRVLAKLRDFLGDDLLVRGSTGMRLTTRAEYLADLVPLAMSQARGIIGTDGATDGARISISANLMPALLPHFAKSSNLAGRRLRISAHRSIGDGIAQLRSRIVDFVLGSGTLQAEDVLCETICDEDFLTLVAFQDHGLDGGPALDRYLEMSHINLIDGNGEIFPQISETLTGHGLHRSDLMEVPDIASAAAMVSQGQFALTVPRSMASWLTRTHRLVAFSPPLTIPTHEIHMSWRAGDRTEDEPLLIREIAAATRRAIAEDEAAVPLVGAMEQEAGSEHG